MKTLISILLLSAIWLMFTQAESASLVIGIPAVIAAVLASRHLSFDSEKCLSMTHLIRFVPHFLMQSIKGGIEVACYTLGLKKPFQSGFFYYHCKLRSDFERTFFNNCVSMMPGTLTVDLNDDWIEVHGIHLNQQTVDELVDLEQKIAGLFCYKELK